eukprot:TRINITY_DN8100_c0_g1_i12.p1 TRINITY_DN8100_c0_g1~~TRINITY_DN8100_c0_g1_i12.p1  ORF type:complete len:906 (-),score=174.16 TRINITY_DN8100_c0_g1_i12:91-2808(-)
MMISKILLVCLICIGSIVRGAPQGLQGPGRGAPIMRSDEFTAAELPMEHRMVGTLLPDVFNIPRSLTSQLQVDFFLSLYFVFLNNDWLQYQESCIVFAPAGLDSEEAARWLQTEEELVEELLLSHIVLGESIRPELLAEPLILSTLSGLEVEVTLDQQGNLLVNGVNVLAMERHDNILLVALEDYLFKDELRSRLSEMLDYDQLEQTTAPRNINSQDQMIEIEILDQDKDPNPDDCKDIRDDDESLSIFKSVTVCTSSKNDDTRSTMEMDKEARKDDIFNTASSEQQEFSKQTKIIEDVTVVNPETGGEIISAARVDEPSEEFSTNEFAPSSDANDATPSVSEAGFDAVPSGDVNDREESDRQRPDILEQIATLIQFFRGSPEIYTFLDFARSKNLATRIPANASFTILAPEDSAFRSWTPIDWGFNPFKVDQFQEEIVVNHVILNTVDLYTPQEKELKTLGGKTVKLSVNPESAFINGVPTLGEIDLLGGKLVFIEEVLFIDDNVVQDLNQKFRYLETGPLITYPWIESQFLSHTYRLLNKDPDFSYLSVYLNLTSDLGSYVPNIYESDTSKRYILLAPHNSAFSSVLPKSAVLDPFLQDSTRLEMLLDHLLLGNFSMANLHDGLSMTTISGNSLMVSNNDSGIFIGNDDTHAKVVGEPIFIYNLGLIIQIDTVLYGQQYIVPEEETTTTFKTTEETTTALQTLETTTTVAPTSSKTTLQQTAKSTSTAATSIFTFPDFLDVFETTTSVSNNKRNENLRPKATISFPSRPSENFKVLQELDSGKIVAERFVDTRIFDNVGGGADFMAAASVDSPKTSNSLGIEHLFQNKKTSPVPEVRTPQKALRRIDENFSGSLVDLFYRGQPQQLNPDISPKSQNIQPREEGKKKKKTRVVYVNNKRIEIDY